VEGNLRGHFNKCAAGGWLPHQSNGSIPYDFHGEQRMTYLFRIQWEKWLLISFENKYRPDRGKV
jgi:hypothetical protein